MYAHGRVKSRDIEIFKDDFDFKGVGRMKVYCFISEAQIFS